MKELISFSLRRRFFNGATILLNVMLCIVACGILFFDKIVDFINPSMFDDQRIYLNLDEIEEDILLNMEMSGVELIVDDRDYQSLIQESPKAYVLYFDDGYKVASQYKIDSNLIDILRGMLQEVHQTMTLSSTLTLEEYEILNQQLDLENIILQEDVSMDQQKENIVFMVITSIYFTMLSFSTSVANEVIYEKSTRQLELILTSVSSKVHFYSKMVVGWLGILIQAIGVVCYVVVATLLRIMFDEGKDLIQFVNKIHLMSIKEDTILKFLSNISIDFDFMSKLFFIFFFLMMGILLLQMVLV
ncbi:MAG: ABC transporter permease, partial [Traorella sp.]